MTEILGHCKDCVFKAQEYLIVYDADGAASYVLDTYCRVHKNFIPDLGFCHVFEPD